LLISLRIGLPRPCSVLGPAVFAGAVGRVSLPSLADCSLSQAAPLTGLLPPLAFCSLLESGVLSFSLFVGSGGPLSSLAGCLSSASRSGPGSSPKPSDTTFKPSSVLGFVRSLVPCSIIGLVSDVEPPSARTGGLVWTARTTAIFPWATSDTVWSVRSAANFFGDPASSIAASASSNAVSLPLDPPAVSSLGRDSSVPPSASIAVPSNVLTARSATIFCEASASGNGSWGGILSSPPTGRASAAAGGASLSAMDNSLDLPSSSPSSILVSMPPASCLPRFRTVVVVTSTFPTADRSRDCSSTPLPAVACPAPELFLSSSAM